MTHVVRRVDPDEFDWSAPDGVAAEVRALLGAAEQADGAAPLDEAALLTLRHSGLAASTLLVTGDPLDGLAWLRDEDVAIVVAPDARRAGRGRALASAVVDLGLPDDVTAWSHGNHPGAASIADDFGFDRVRDLWVMRRRLDDLPPLVPSDGYDVRTFRPGHDEAAFLAVNGAAFAHHPEQGAMTRHDLDQRMAEPWFDPAGFFVAVRSGTDGGDGPADGDAGLVGFHWTKVHDGERLFGEVYVVGVSPEAQGSGLGRLLTLTGLHHLAGLGLDEVVLYVESDNAPAIAVYARLGFTHADTDTHVQYRRRPVRS